jgi:hypothetical protein
MTKRGRVALFVMPNGDIFQKTVVKHRDGRFGVKKKKVACGIGRGPKVEAVAERIPLKESIQGKKKPEKKKLIKPSSARRVFRERLHTSQTIFSGGSYVDTIKPTYVETTNNLPKLLRQAKARNGSHIDQFQRDHEKIAAALKSLDLGGARGGSGLPLPIEQIQAQDRIKEFQRVYPQSYLICKLVIVDGVDVKSLPVSKTMDGGGLRMLQGAVDDLAGFYSPTRTRPDKKLVEFAREMERQARGGRG